SSVSASASAFMCPTISSVPSPASVTIAVTSPSRSKRGEKASPSSSAALSEGGGGKLSMSRPCRCGRAAAGLSGEAVSQHHHEAGLLFRLVPEDAREGGGQRGRSFLADAA